MQFEKGYLYHIYNQGNNQRDIFFNTENHLFFLKKIKKFILPYADIIAWCLMPNHFHLMVLVREERIPVIESNTETRSNSNTVTPSHGVTKSENDTKTPSHGVTKTNSIKTRTFNDSIGIMLRSYTRAINKQENFSGKLFREKTKAECINCPEGVTPSFIESKINIQNPEEQYPQVCFDYIHQNPVKAKLVDKETDWEFSSAKDYANIRNGKLVNKTVAFEYINYG